MASRAASRSHQSAAGSPSSGGSSQYDQFIESQLARTRWRVKLVDLSSVIMLLAGGLIAVLFVIVLIDHWLVELGVVGRSLALILLVGGTAYYLAMVLVPMFVRRINPVYAARAIEQTAPSLKNSLINYLLFRGDSSRSGNLIRRALRHRAALDLKQVNIDLAVDRSRLIHIGYAVVALMLLFVGYTIFSPKDVFQTMLRVAAPWAELARPSRVQISDVQPGDATVIYGERVSISTRILGVGEDEAVTLYYSTDDKQTVDRQVVMQRPETGQRFQCLLPDDMEGIQQSVTYRIAAGDAHTRDFHLRVLPAPTILVERIEYEYPAYMQRARQVIEREGAIDAPEGTRVTVRGRASRPIGSALIEYDPEAASGGNGRRPVSRRMQFKGQRAWYTFPLLMDQDRRQPQYLSYQLSFKTKDNLASHNPIAYDISVTPDLAPEVAILTPEDDQIEVPINGRQRIEIRAVDPDFGLSLVALRGVVGNQDLFQETLMSDDQGRLGQVVTNYSFSPRKLGLAVGDKVIFWAVAEDNRRSPVEDNPEPNRERTRNYHITIVPADPTAGGASSEANEPDKDAANDQQAAGQQESSKMDRPEDQSLSDDEQPAKEDGKNAPNDKASQPQEEAGQSGGEERKQEGSNQDKSGQSGQEKGSQGSPSQSAQAAGEQSQGQTGEQAGEGSGGAGSQSGEQMQANDQGGANSSSDSGSGNQAGDQGDASSGAARGRRSQSSEGDNNSPGQPAGSDELAGEGGGNAGQQERSEPLHDGEVFERAMQRFGQNRGQSRPAGQDATTPTPGETSSEPNPTNPRDVQSEGNAGQEPADDQGRPSNDSSAARSQQGKASDQASGKPTAGQLPGSGTEPEGQNADTPTPAGTGQKRAQGEGENGSPSQPPGSMGENQRAPKSVEQREQPGSQVPETGQKGAGLGDEGDAGSGKPTDQESGAPSSMKQNIDTEKTTVDPNREQSDAGRPPQPSKSKRQRNVEGSQGGRESGGGEHGGGQDARQEGRDSPGSTTSSDQGNAGSPESGTGETADRAGDKQASAGQTGQTGQQAGRGSQNKSAQQGTGSNESASPPTGQPQPMENSEKGESRAPAESTDRVKTRTGPGGGQPTGGGGLAGDVAPPAARETEIPEGDKANLEYARKATDLVLERLKDQANEPDPELLKDLDWSKDDLQRFLARWETMKRTAREEGGEAQEELDDALRSLGLRRSGPTRRGTGAASDQLHGLKESGIRSRPPAQFLEQFDAYKKGAAREPARDNQPGK